MPRKVLADGGVVEEQDWRAPELPYEVPEDLRLPVWVATHGSQECPAPTELLAVRLETLILNGASVANAKCLLSVPKKRWLLWKERAQAGDAPYRQLFARVEMARAHVEATALTTINRAAVHPDPKVAVPAAEKTLALSNPARYGTNRQKVDVTVKGRVEIDTRAVHAIVSMTPEQLAALVSGTLDTNAGRLLLGEEAAPMGASRPDEGDE